MNRFVLTQMKRLKKTLPYIKFMLSSAWTDYTAFATDYSKGLKCPVKITFAVTIDKKKP